MCFMDYSKTFDYVDHAGTLWDMGLPEHLTVLLHNLYRDPEATVRIEKGETEPFNIGKGMKQSCILLPILLILFNL